MPTRLLALLLTSLALCATPAAAKSPAPSLIEQALACHDATDCPYFPEVYKNDRTFRLAFLIELRKANIRRPRWVPDGVTTPLTPVDLDGSPRLLTSVCEPHNCGHRFMLVYDPQEKSVAGTYTSTAGTGNGGEAGIVVFGQPSMAEMDLLKPN